MDWRAVLAAAQATPPPRAALEEVIAATWSGARVRDLTLLPGGLSSVLHRVDLDDAPVQSVVLRELLREFGADAATVRREAAAHQTAAAAGVPVPAVHWDDPDGAVLGRPALLLDLVEGWPLIGDLASPAAQVAMAEAVHAVGRVPAAPSPEIPHLDDMSAVVTRFGPPALDSDLVDAAALHADVIAAAGAFEPGAALVHVDLHGGNVLWDGAVVTAILDWPGAAIGNPLADEAYCWVDTVLAHGPAVGADLQRHIDASRPGPPPSRAQVHLWRGLALLRPLPTPSLWGEAYRATGVDVDDETVDRRYVALVEDHLEKG